MKHSLLIAALLLVCASSAFPQGGTGGSYRVDNFDFVNAVRIMAPPPAASAPIKTRRGKSRNAGYSASAGSINAIINDRMAEIKGNSSMGGFTTGNATIDGFIVESGRRNAVDPLLLYAIMHQESTFKARALSNKGARGLMQLMPGTAVRFGVTSIWDPQQNIEGGTRYMRFLLDKFDGNVELALAGYNAGEGAVMKYGYRIPPYNETQEYVRRISKRYSLIRDPLAARSASLLTRGQVAANQKESAPLSMYERSVFAVRLPDGRLQLVTQ
jgi:soluble lytic murein transglycosylase-like protein